MNTTMIFSGLFTAVTATIASMTVSGLSQDPNVVMQVLLQNILISVNSTSGSIPQGIPLPEWNGPSVSIVWFQTLLYASLVCSLLVALGAVLATQWLSRYRAVDERGTIEDRGKRRQQKFDGLRVWGFRLFLEALPILLQFSLLLFGVSLCAYMWDQQRVIAAVLIFANGVGGLLWLFTLIVSAIYPESPYDTPLSDLLARMSHSKDVAPAAENFSPASTSASTVSPHTTSSQDQVSANCETRSTTAAVTAFGKPIPILNWVLTRWHRIRGRESVDPERADPQSQTPSSPPSRRTRLATRAPVDSRGENPVSPSSPVTHATHAAVSKVITKVFGPVVRTHKARLARSFPTLNEVRMAAFSWLMETSTDPEVHVNAFLVVPEIIWTDEQFTRESFSLQTLDFLLEKLAGCFQADGHPKGDNVERLVSLCASFFFIFWQLYRVASVTTHTWTQKSGLAFVRTHDAMVKALASMSLKTLKPLPHKSLFVSVSHP
ncbi:hypothetical protein BXZ70DRAFT_482641 [Cristinia sonorae]|uniref:DUF6535 domain-containing protein n=1 Tax=Cristinia sonorae TaxID=1940300 RepID=A0A8K0XLL4_9AGAR|nr:hypothetical protein BXZ70DRAFT_482641 [Cristinia sonorae]